jgi:hypothetical protein
MSRIVRCPSGESAFVWGVVVMAELGVAEPRQPHRALTLRQHVRDDACLSRRQRVDDEVRLNLRDPWIVGQIGDVLGLLEVLAVVGRQARHGALELPHRGEVLVERVAIGLSERRLQVGGWMAPAAAPGAMPRVSASC